MNTLRGRHKGREKVRKYGATYTFVKQSEIKVQEGDEDEMGEETCTVRTVRCVFHTVHDKHFTIIISPPPP